MADRPNALRPIYNALAPRSGTEYADLWPWGRRPDGSTAFPVMPNALRQGLTGMLDAVAATETGSLTPEAVQSVTLGGIGTGMALAPVNALASGASRIRAYHGSPHNFDRFDMSKIGTGEGAQAYGHGLYFAGNEAVAKSYKKAGTHADHEINRINGRLSEIAREMDKYRGGTYNTFTDPKGYQLRAEYDALLEKRANLGHMYEVDIHADPARFLDWDKPLSQQPPAVRQIAQESFPQDAINRDILGGSMYRGVSRGLDPLASEFMRDAGIPGIRYLDGGSRSAGQGSSNYVVFDDSLIEILRKYMMGAPAPVAVPGGNALAPAQKRAFLNEGRVY